jgi:hypothetical protein
MCRQFRNYVRNVYLRNHPQTYNKIMRPIWKQIIIKLTSRRNQVSTDKNYYSNYQKVKAYREFIISLKRNIKDFILITAGIFSASFGFKGFTNQPFY